jgi:hypothetical protein
MDYDRDAHNLNLRFTQDGRAYDARSHWREPLPEDEEEEGSSSTISQEDEEDAPRMDLRGYLDAFGISLDEQMMHAKALVLTLRAEASAKKKQKRKK